MQSALMQEIGRVAILPMDRLNTSPLALHINLREDTYVIANMRYLQTHPDNDSWRVSDLHQA